MGWRLPRRWWRARAAGAEVVIRRVPELMPEETLKAIGARTDQPHPIATVDELPAQDDIAFRRTMRFSSEGGGTISGAQGARMPLPRQFAVARLQGSRVAEVAAKLFG